MLRTQQAEQFLFVVLTAEGLPRNTLREAQSIDAPTPFVLSNRESYRNGFSCLEQEAL